MKQNTLFPSVHSGVANCTGLIAFSYSIFPADNSHLIGFLHLFYAPARGLMKLVCIFISNITALCRIRYFGFSVRIAFSIFLRLRIIPGCCLVFKPHRLCLHNIIYNPSPGRVNKRSVRCFSANYQIAAVRKIIAFCRRYFRLSSTIRLDTMNCSLHWFRTTNLVPHCLANRKPDCR